MRQNRAFPPIRPQPEPEPPAPSSRLVVLRQRLTGYYSRFQIIVFFLIGVITALASIYVYDITRPPAQHLTQRDINSAVNRVLATATPPPSFQSQVYNIIHPSVVQIKALSSGSKGGVSYGTGVVIEDTGTILTCLHVITGAAAVRVIFADGTESEAAVAGRLPDNDLAVLMPQEIPDDLQPATLTSSSTLHVGDDVIAVGNPFGIDNSLTSGVVSGLGRNFKARKTGQVFTNLIQFDAAVNPGNSGGPLLNRRGEVVGIVTGLLNPNEQDVFIGIGFAIPLDSAGGALGAPWY